jgi:hypothetical protein
MNMVLRSSFALGGAALAIGLGLASAVHAQTAARDTPSGSMRALTADEAAALAAKPDAKTPPARGLLTGKINPAAIVHPDGTVEQELDDSTVVYSVARRNADGSISTYCVPGAKNAERLMRSTTAVVKTGKGQAHEHK